MAGRTEAAVRIHDVAKEAALRHRNVVRGVVLRAKPLRVELLRTDEVLEDDELDLTQWVKFYEAKVGIARGDEVMLLRERGEWTIIDVASDSDLAAFEPSEPEASAYVETFTATGSDTITHGLGTRDVIVQARRANAPYFAVEGSWRRNTEDTISSSDMPVGVEVRVLVLAVVV